MRGPRLTGTVRRAIRVALAGSAVVAVVSLVGPVVFGARGPAPSGPPTAEAARAIEGLRESAVYLEPGGRWTMDVAKARAEIGDRPILVAGFSDPARFNDQAAEYQQEIARYDGKQQESIRAGYTEGLLELDVPLALTCRDIAEEYPDTMVVVVHPRENFKYACTGPDFAEDEDTDFARWAAGPSASAEIAAENRTRSGDLTPFVSELVAAVERSTRRFDVPPETRDLGGPFRTWYLAGYVAAGVAAAILLFLGARWLRHQEELRRGRRRAREGARAQAMADVQRLATMVMTLEREHLDHLRAADADDHADLLVTLSRQYVRIATEFEEAKSGEDFERVSAVATEALEPGGKDTTPA